MRLLLHRPQGMRCSVKRKQQTVEDRRLRSTDRDRTLFPTFAPDGSLKECEQDLIQNMKTPQATGSEVPAWTDT